METHCIGFPPSIDSDCQILVLGSMPSVKSLSAQQYYAHPQNRFWKVITAVINNSGMNDKNIEVPVTIEEKMMMLHNNHIALWDTIYSCDIIGSSDSSIKNVVPTDLGQIISNSRIERVYCNGAASGNYYKKYQQKVLGIEAVVLPSTSPANAAYSLDRLIGIWSGTINI